MNQAADSSKKTILMIDADPIFRLGMEQAIQQSSLKKYAWAAIGNLDLEAIVAHHQPSSLVLIIIDPQLSSRNHWPLLGQLRRHFPETPMVVLTSFLNGALWEWARIAGVGAYEIKGQSLAVLTEGFKTAIAQKNTSLEHHQKTLKQGAPWQLPWVAGGLREIETALASLDRQLAQGAIASWRQLFYQGQRRELKTARWLVQRCLPPAYRHNPESWRATPAPAEIPPPSDLPAVVPSALPLKSQQWLGAIAPKLTLPLQNRTARMVELEILRPEIQAELLTLVAVLFQQKLQSLEFAQLQRAQLPQAQGLFVQELWRDVTLTLLRKYLTLGPDEWATQLQPQLARAYEDTMVFPLGNFPLIGDFLAHLLWADPLLIDNVPYGVQTPEAQQRAIAIFDHLCLTVANGTVQFILNSCPEQEEIKHQLYRPNYRSSRQIAAFRNRLSSGYWRDTLWDNPRLIFESQYRLWALAPGKITEQYLHGPRQNELNQLRGIPAGVTLLLEFRDAIAPMVRTTVNYLGQIVVYLLTQVIGRAIGLIGKGIMDGIGNSWQGRSRYPKQKNP